MHSKLLRHLQTPAACLSLSLLPSLAEAADPQANTEKDEHNTSEEAAREQWPPSRVYKQIGALAALVDSVDEFFRVSPSHAAASQWLKMREELLLHIKSAESALSEKPTTGELKAWGMGMQLAVRTLSQHLVSLSVPNKSSEGPNEIMIYGTEFLGMQNAARIARSLIQKSGREPGAGEKAALLALDAMADSTGPRELNSRLSPLVEEWIDGLVGGNRQENSPLLEKIQAALKDVGKTPAAALKGDGADWFEKCGFKFNVAPLHPASRFNAIQKLASSAEGFALIKNDAAVLLKKLPSNTDTSILGHLNKLALLPDARQITQDQAEALFKSLNELKRVR